MFGTFLFVLPTWIRKSGKHFLALSVISMLTLSLNPLSGPAGATASLALSSFASRSAPIPLNGETVAGDIYILAAPSSEIVQVLFFIDDPQMLSGPYRVDNKAPYDLAGGSTNGAVPYDTTQLSDGPHTITASIELFSGFIEIVHAEITIANQAPKILLSQQVLVINTQLNGIPVVSSPLTVQTEDGLAVPIEIRSSTPWLRASPATGQTPAETTVTVDPSTLTLGTYSGTLSLSAPGYLTGRLPVIMNVDDPSQPTSLKFSLRPDRMNPLPLEGEAIAGEQFVFVDSALAIVKASFYIDDPLAEGQPVMTDNNAPFDLAGGKVDTANPYNTRVLNDGAHILTTRLELEDGSIRMVQANFTIGNEWPALIPDKSTLVFSAIEGQTVPNLVLTLDTSDGSSASYQISDDMSWLQVIPYSGATPENLIASADISGLNKGSYSGIITAMAEGYLPARIGVTLSVTPQSSPHGVVYSQSADRANAIPLNGAVIDGPVYVFASPDSDISRVAFYIDDPLMSSGPYVVDNRAPFDLGGGSIAVASAFDTTSLTDGTHFLTLLLTLTDGRQEILYTSFTVGNTTPVLILDSQQINLTVDLRYPTGSTPLNITTSNGSAATVTFLETTDWLSFSPASGTTPAQTLVTANVSGLATGNYSAVVTVSGPGTQSVVFPVYLTVTDVDIPPVALPGGPYSGLTGAPISFDGSASYDPDVEPITWHWDFGDGSTATGAKPVHSYTNAGVYTVTLVVSDGYKSSTPVATTADVNASPVANAGSDFTVNENTSASLDGSASSDSDGTISAYQWTQTSGPVVTLTGATSAVAGFTAPEVITDQALGFQLTVTDNKGASSSDSVAVLVRNVNKIPVASAGADFSVVEGATAVLDGSASHDLDGTITAYQWSQISGPAATLTTPDQGTSGFVAPEVHVDTALEFALMVTDNEGVSATDHVIVTVQQVNKPPVISAVTIYPDVIDDTQTAQLSVIATDPDPDTVLSYQWSSPGGTFDDPSSATPIFAPPDVSADHTFTLRVTVSDGATSTSSDIAITVSDAAAAGGVYPPGTLPSTLTGNITLDGTYYTDTELYVPSGSVLTILPGTIIYFNIHEQLIVEGTVIAEGTAEAPITFTSVYADKSRYPNQDPLPGYWTGITVIPGAISSFDHVIINYPWNGIVAIGTDLNVHNSQFSEYYISGIRVYPVVVSSPAQRPVAQITGNTLTGYSSYYTHEGISVAHTEAYIQGNTVSNNFRGVDVFGEDAKTIVNAHNVISNNTYGIAASWSPWVDDLNFELELSVNQNSILDNYYNFTIDGINSSPYHPTKPDINLEYNWWGSDRLAEIAPKIIDRSVANLDYVPFLDGPPPDGQPVDGNYLGGTLDDSTVTLQPGTIYELAANITVPAGSTLTIPEGVELRFLPSGKLEVLGTLNVEGTAFSPVKFTTGIDKTVSRHVSKYAADWYGLVIDAGTANIKHAVIEWAYAGVTAKSATVSISDSVLKSNYYGVYEDVKSTVDIAANNIITSNYYGIYARGNGIVTDSPSLLVTGNDIYDNVRYALYTYNFGSGAPVIDATSNWWGTASSSLIESAVYHNRDRSTSPAVDYSSFHPDVLVSRLEGTLSGDKSIITDIRYWVTADTTVSSASTLRLTDGAQLRFRDGTGLNVAGTLITRGDWDLPVVFTADRASPSTGTWKGLSITGNADLQGAEIIYAEQAVGFVNSAGNMASTMIKRSGTGLYISGSATPTIGPNNVISLNNVGVIIEGGAAATTDPSPRISGNNILYNIDANIVATNFINPGSATLDLTGNWWGSAVPVEIATGILDRQDGDSTAPLANAGYPLGQSAIVLPLPSVDYSMTLRSGIWYETTGSLLVSNNRRLTVEAGATLRFSSGGELRANQGTLDIAGEAYAPVTLTSGNAGASKGDWNGIVFSARAYQGTSAIRHAHILNSRNGVEVTDRTVTGLIIENSDISRFTESGIAIPVHTVATIRGNKLSNDGTGIGILLQGSSSVVEANTISGTTIGVVAGANSALYLKPRPSISNGNTITGNGIGIYVQGGGNAYVNPLPTINGNNIHDNGSYNLFTEKFGGAQQSSEVIDATGNWWGTVNFSSVRESIHDINGPDPASVDGSEPEVSFLPYLNGAWPEGSLFTIQPVTGGRISDTNTTLVPGYIYDITTDLTVVDSLTIPDGVIFRFSAGAGLLVQGTLTVSGTAESPVRFSGPSSPTSSESWNGITVTGSVHMDHAIIEGADAGIKFDNSNGTISHTTVQYNNIGIYIYGASSPRIENGNRIANNDLGILAEGTGLANGNPSPYIRESNIYDNLTLNLSTRNYFDGQSAVLYAKFNWWGSAVHGGIENSIFHRIDPDATPATQPLADFSPYLDELDGLPLTNNVVEITTPGVTLDGANMSEGTTYFVREDITLGGTIPGGVVFRTENMKGIKLDGYFSTNSTWDNPVVFSILRTEASKYSNDPYVKHWHGLTLNGDASGTSISNAIIEHAFTGITNYKLNAVTIGTNLLRRNHTGIGLYFDTRPLVTGNLFTENESAIFSNGSKARIIDGNRFKKNVHGIVIEQNGGQNIPGPEGTRFNVNPLPVINNNIFEGGLEYDIEARSFNPEMLPYADVLADEGYNYGVVGRVNAVGNQWGTTDPAEIARRVYDRADMMEENSWVDFSGYLDSEDNPVSLPGHISGPIEGATLTAGANYTVIGETFLSGTVPAGITFEFVDGYALNVGGLSTTLAGTDQQPITLKPKASGVNGGWIDATVVRENIHPITGNPVPRLLDIHHVVINGAHTGIRIASTSFMGLLGHPGYYGTFQQADVSNARLIGNAIGIWVDDASPKITDSIIQDSIVAMMITDLSNPEITSSTLDINQYGIFVYSANDMYEAILREETYVNDAGSTKTRWVFSHNEIVEANPVANFNRITNSSDYKYVATNYVMKKPQDPLLFIKNYNLDATNNWWGTTDPIAVADSIFDMAENSESSPPVNISPYLTQDGTVMPGNFLSGVIDHSQLVSGETYKVIGNLLVSPNRDANRNLISSIPPGTRLEFADGYRVTLLNGAIIGSADPNTDPVVLTSGMPTKMPGDWDGIYIDERSCGYDAHVSYVTPHLPTVQGVTIEYADIAITIVDLADSMKFTVYDVIGVPPDLELVNPREVQPCTGAIINNNTLKVNNTGISVRNSGVRAGTNNIHDNIIAFTTKDVAGYFLTENTIKDNQIGIYIDGEGKTLPDSLDRVSGTAKDNRIHNNAMNIVVDNFTPAEDDLLDMHFNRAITGYLDFQQNWWGTDDVHQIEASIFHRADDRITPLWINYGHWSDTEGNPTPTALLFDYWAVASTLPSGMDRPLDYYAISDLYVGSLTTAGAAPGTTIHFLPGTQLDIYGSMRILADRQTPVTFKSSLTNPAPGDWKGIVVHSRKFSLATEEQINLGEFLLPLKEFNLSGVNILHAETGIDIPDGTSDRYLESRSYDVRVNDALFSRNKTGIHVLASPVLRTIVNNGHCYLADNGYDCVKEYNGNPYHLYPAPMIINSRFMDNTENHLTATGDSEFPVPVDARYNWWGSPNLADVNAGISDSLDSNTAPSVAIAPWRLDEAGSQLSPYGSFGGTVNLRTPPLTTDHPWLAVGDIKVPAGINYTIPAGTQLDFNTGRRLINTGGTLTIGAVDGAPTLLSSAQDAKQTRDWQGILTQGGTTNVYNTIVEYAYNALTWETGATGQVDYASLRRNTNGMYVSGGLATQDPTLDSFPVIHHSNFYDNGNYNYKAVDFTRNADGTPRVLDANHNWWGTTSPQKIELSIYDNHGDANAPLVDWNGTLLNNPTKDLPNAIDITYPASGLLTPETMITVRGTLDTPGSSQVTVNGFGVTLEGDSFTARVPLEPGQNTVLARSVSAQGQVSEDSIAITRIDQGLIALSATPDSGYDPLTVSFTINNTAPAPITGVDMDFNGDGQMDASFPGTGPITHLYTTGGVYRAEALISTQGGDKYLANTLIEVKARADEPPISDLRIIAPVDGATLNGDRILVQGSYAGPDDVTITLNGQPVLAYGDRWYVNNLHLVPGANSLTARAVSADGQVEEITVTVNSGAPSIFYATVTPEQGLIPLLVSVTPQYSGSEPLTLVEIDVDGDGVMDVSSGDPSVPLTINFEGIGDHVMTVVGTDGFGQSYVHKVAVVSEQSVNQLDGHLRGIYNALLNRLRAKDVEGAMQYFAGTSKEKYRNIYTALLDFLPNVADDTSNLANGRFSPSGGWAEYYIIRQADGEARGYPVLFLLSEDGIWRIESM